MFQENAQAQLDGFVGARCTFKLLNALYSSRTLLPTKYMVFDALCYLTLKIGLRKNDSITSLIQRIITWYSLLST